jgi:transposase InsO family protein
MHGYNTAHAHSSLGYLMPEEFLATHETAKPPQDYCPRSGADLKP